MSDSTNIEARFRMANPIPDPANPPVSVVTAAAVLLDVEERSGTMQTKEPITTPTRTRRRRNDLIVGAAAFVAVLVAGIVIVLVTATGDESTPATEPSTTVTTAAPTTTLAALPVPTREEVVAGLVAAVNDGDLDGAMARISEDARCFAPAMPTCEDIFGFFVAGDAEIVLTECSVITEPYLQCEGYVYGSMQEALGISRERLAGSPQFVPAFEVEDGLIVRINLTGPFTGDGRTDELLFLYLTDLDASYMNEDGIVVIGPEMAAQLLEDVKAFAEQQGS